MPQYAALVEYDGTAYYGFQRQRREQPTIQSEIEQALYKIRQKPGAITGAGRTDSGVHALGQVISFSIDDWPHGATALQRALNANLPVDIVIYQLKPVSSSFHPRFDARRRAYVYKIYPAAVRSPTRRLNSWHVRKRLDVNNMKQAARQLVGIHDFATFGQPPQGNKTVREVYTARWQQQGEYLEFYIEANAFLYRMVRSIVGSMKLVGDGTWTVDEFAAALQAKDRSFAGKTAPPQGLYLVSVTYEHVELGEMV
ncbi:MAG: tRNA pseudouridine(38-40) synthase TruA [Chloroflexi bacterium]|nr:tRNA pseudouridine(38-40) synthase TruA [Chloroflexota bacterium]